MAAVAHVTDQSVLADITKDAKEWLAAPHEPPKTDER